MTHSAAIILSRPDRVGDVLIATACLPALRQQRPGERIVLVAREVMRPLLEDHPLLTGFIGLPAGSRGFGWLAEMRALTAELQAQNAAALVHLHPDTQCQFAAWRAGIPRRLGYRTSILADWTLTERQRDQRQQGAKHEAEYNFDVLAPLGIQAPPLASLRPQVHLAPRWQEILHAKLGAAGHPDLGRYVVLNPTAYSLLHRWPPENFAWLARELQAHCDHLVLVGESGDDPSVKSLRALLGDLSPASLDLAGQLNLAELGWLLRGASLLVSRNTGTTHLAAAVDCPTVELFGRLEPAYGPTRWRSLGSHVRAVSTPETTRRPGESKRAFWQRGYLSIPRAAVASAALKLLATRPDSF